MIEKKWYFVLLLPILISLSFLVSDISYLITFSFGVLISIVILIFLFRPDNKKALSVLVFAISLSLFATFLGFWGYTALAPDSQENLTTDFKIEIGDETKNLNIDCEPSETLQKGRQGFDCKYSFEESNISAVRNLPENYLINYSWQNDFSDKPPNFEVVYERQKLYTENLSREGSFKVAVPPTDMDTLRLELKGNWLYFANRIDEHYSVMGQKGKYYRLYSVNELESTFYKNILILFNLLVVATIWINTVEVLEEIKEEQ